MKSPTDRLYDVRADRRQADRPGREGPGAEAAGEAEELAGPTVKGNKGGFNLGLVAEALARLDLPAALKMLDDLAQQVRKNDKTDRTYVFVRFYGNIAHKLAAEAPADAERMLERIRGARARECQSRMPRRLLEDGSHRPGACPPDCRDDVRRRLDRAQAVRAGPDRTEAGRDRQGRRGSNCSRPLTMSWTIWPSADEPRPCTATPRSPAGYCRLSRKLCLTAFPSSWHERSRSVNPGSTPATAIYQADEIAAAGDDDRTL